MPLMVNGRRVTANEFAAALPSDVIDRLGRRIADLVRDTDEPRESEVAS